MTIDILSLSDSTDMLIQDGTNLLLNTTTPDEPVVEALSEPTECNFPNPFIVFLDVDHGKKRGWFC